MTDRDLLELIASQVSHLTTRVDGLTRDMVDVKADLRFTKEAVIRIENDHGLKLGALLNGYKQNEERLDRVEAKLAEHDEILMKRL